MPAYVCPTCQTMLVVEQNVDAPFRPFCSQRCKMVDLGRWLDGTYAISEPVRAEGLEDTTDDEPQA